MITSTSPIDRSGTTPPIGLSTKPAVQTAAPRSDQFNTSNASYLIEALIRNPEIRPQVVERARALAADPNYPPIEVVRRVAEQILNSPDLSEDHS